LAEDEISLRELYLVFRRGLVWILAVSLVIAALVFVVLYLQPNRYQATATVRMTPLQFTQPQQATASPQAQQNLLDLSAITQIGFDAYKTLALSRETLKATLDRLDTVPKGLTVADVADHLRLTKLSGGGADPLVVAQTVVYRDPGTAASLANAWAAASTAAVQDSITSDMSHLSKTLASELVSSSDTLNAAESKWTAFQKQDERDSLRSQLTALNSRITGAQQQLDTLERQASATQAKQALLRAVVQARTTGNTSSLDQQVQALTAAGVLQPPLAEQLAGALAEVPGGTAQSPQDVATVVARTELQQQAGDLAGYAAERDTVQQQLASFAKQQADLRIKLAGQQQTADQLQRQVDTATQTYQQLSSVAPILRAAGTLAPDMASVFSHASTPDKALSHRTVTAAVVAFVLAFIVMLVGVFLRAAVAEPSLGGVRRRDDDARAGDGTAPASGRL